MNAGGPKRAHAPRVPFALLVIGLLLGGLVLLLVLNTASAANELRRGSLADRDQEVSADVAQLRNEVAASAAPGNLARAAQALGMVPAGNPAFIVEYPDGRTVLRGHAKAASDDPLDLPTGTPHASPTPTSRATATPTGTSTATPTGTAKTSTSATHKASATHPRTTSKHPKARRHAHRGKAHRHAAKPTAPASPTATPTPTITLPGGNK